MSGEQVVWDILQKQSQEQLLDPSPGGGGGGGVMSVVSNDVHYRQTLQTVDQRENHWIFCVCVLLGNLNFKTLYLVPVAQVVIDKKIRR